MATSKRQGITSVGEDVKRRKHSCTVGAAAMEDSMEFPQKIENSTTVQSSNSTPGCKSGRIEIFQKPWELFRQIMLEQLDIRQKSMTYTSYLMQKLIQNDSQTYL